MSSRVLCLLPPQDIGLVPQGPLRVVQCWPQSVVCVCELRSREGSSWLGAGCVGAVETVSKSSVVSGRDRRVKGGTQVRAGSADTHAGKRECGRQTPGGLFRLCRRLPCFGKNKVSVLALMFFADVTVEEWYLVGRALRHPSHKTFGI